MSTDLRSENELVLQRMADRGDDLSTVRIVDFTAVFVDEPSALAFARKVETKGYTIDIEESGTAVGYPWEVVASRKMAPSLDEITDAELGLGDFAEELGGKMDGWGWLGPD
jgi:hypothetical protein